MNETRDDFWAGVATGILIAATFGVAVYAVALVQSCVL